MSLKIRVWARIEPWFDDERIRETEACGLLLEEISSRWGIAYDLLADFDDEEVYRQVFYSRRNVLRRRTGRSVRSELRSRSGNFFVNGTGAVFDDAEPLYYVAHGRNKFLASLFQHGHDWLRAIVAENETKEARFSRADRLAAQFCRKAPLLGFRGQIRREYPLNLPEIAAGHVSGRNLFRAMSAKSIDILHQERDRYDVIEAKPRLNWEARGQALGYAELLCLIENIPRDHIRSHVVCEQTDDATSVACERLGVNVIVFKADE